MSKIELIVKALHFYGDYKADKLGFSSGEECWDLAFAIDDLTNNNHEQAQDIAQLTVKDLLNGIIELAETMEIADILKMPIYIGNDDELNGIHCAWYRQPIDSNNEDDADLVDLINDDSCNNECNVKAFLIS